MIFIKKLPKIYQNDINKPIHNNKKMCYVNKEKMKNEVLPNEMTSQEINDFINHIFNTTGYAFNTNVMIKTQNDIYHTSLIAKRNDYILTIDEDKIRIEDIKSITKEEN